MSSTAETVNPLGQPIGPAVPGWTAPPRPQRTVLTGRYCRLEPLECGRHAADLHAANSLDREGRMWTYLFSGPFATLDEFTAWLESREDSLDPLYFAIVDAGTGRATGIASYLRIEPAHGTIEVGHLAFSPLLQRTPAATEAMYLMMKHAFELGYRRYEWKCDALNAASRRAAERLGFQVRGNLPPGGRLQGPQSRHGMVFDHRQRVARARDCIPRLARPHEFRLSRPATAITAGNLTCASFPTV